MANISISMNLKAYKGFKYLVEKDSAGNKVYYAAVPVKELFNPSGTTNVYATAVMIPTPGSQYSDFMLKPMLSAKELQSMTQDQFRALPVLGTGKYLEHQVSKDLMKEAAKSASVDEEDMSTVFGMQSDQPSPQYNDAAPMCPASDSAAFAPLAAPIVPSMTPAPAPNPTLYPDGPNSLYYITENNKVLAQARTWGDASTIFKAQQSATALLYKYEGNAVVVTWTKEHFRQLGL